MNLIATADQMKKGKGPETFIGVVRAVHTRPAVFPDQRTIRSGISIDKGDTNLIHHVNQASLLNCPIGRANILGSFDCRNLSHKYKVLSWKFRRSLEKASATFSGLGSATG